MSLSVATLLLSAAYLALLFGIAYWADQRADAGRSVISNPAIYSLSLAVYATSWTFYGSVGRAAASGVGFLPIYLGPTLMAALYWVVLRKMIRISKVNRITSIADFIGARYGRSGTLAGLVTVIAVVGVIPYIALQLKAVAASYLILRQYPDVVIPPHGGAVNMAADTGLYVALLMAAFTVAFGTRHLDATERHEGMVAAIAVESIVKLLAFTAVGLWVTYGLFDGMADLFGRAAALPQAERLLQMPGTTSGYGAWTALVFLSMLAVLFLPRQFQVGVVENVNEDHLRRATWMFPLYLLAINVFVLPITLAGLLQFDPGQVNADTFVLALPMSQGQPALTLLVFIGGLSAATGMVIVETIALSTMICNDLVMPVLLRWNALALQRRRDLSRLLLGIRRGAIVGLMVLGYAYYRAAGEAYALVSIGLVSFAAVAQFAPAMLGGMYWRQGTHAGAMTGLALGFGMWLYTLLLPSFVRSDWLPASILADGPWGLTLLKPTALFGLEGLDDTTHALLWSLLANTGGYVAVSLMGRQSLRDRAQAALFVDVFKAVGQEAPVWRGRAAIADIVTLVGRFIGPDRARSEFEGLCAVRGLTSIEELQPDANLVLFAQNLLAGAIGNASARLVLGSVVQEEPLSMQEVLHILDETSQLMAYSRELEEKSRQLQEATAELRTANERLRELDRLKDDFISTVTHELRTPLTSIRALSEILHQDPRLKLDKRKEFLGIIVRESERLTRLINQVLDLAKLESGRAEWAASEVDLREIVQEAVDTTRQLMDERGVVLGLFLPESTPRILADRDRLLQVMLNLLSNAAKFCSPGEGRIDVHLHVSDDLLQVDVRDNGPGIALADHEIIFEKFRQGSADTLTAKPAGTGLGLPISRQIVEHFGGRLWVNSVPGQGATFSFSLPRAPRADRSTSRSSP